VLGGGG